ncbi:MAG: hypothetical protein ABTQ25_07000 [Nitrosomonas ureae]
MRTIQFSMIFYTALLMAFVSSAVSARQDLSEIQRQFNAETINKRFSVPNDAALTSALKEATQRSMPTRTQRFAPGCVGLGCGGGAMGLGNFGYGSYFGGYARPYYGGLYGVNNYLPFYSGW